MFRNISVSIVFSAFLAVTTLLLWGSTALAAPPSNDTFAGAIPVLVGDSDMLDTTEATTDGDDAQLNESCGAPATDASVWYVLDGTDTSVVVDVFQSDYSAGILVGVGSQGDLQTVACGVGAVTFFAAAETTYYVLAIDDQADGGDNGGLLSISFNEVQTPAVDMTVNPIGEVNTHTGIATISGTYTCTGDFISVNIEAHQGTGRFSVFGSGGILEPGACDGASHDWTVDVVPLNGKFVGGNTMTLTFAFTCGPFDCAAEFTEQTVRLRPAQP